MQLRRNAACRMRQAFERARAHRRRRHDGRVGAVAFHAQRRHQGPRFEQVVQRVERERTQPDRQRTGVDQRNGFTRGELDVAVQVQRDVGHDRHVALAGGAPQVHLEFAPRVKCVDQHVGQHRPHAQAARGHVVQHHHQHGAHHLRRGQRPQPHVVRLEQAAVELAKTRRVQRHAGFGADAGGHAVDQVTARDDALDQRTRGGHLVQCGWRQADLGPMARDARDLVRRQAAAVNFEWFNHGCQVFRGEGIDPGFDRVHGGLLYSSDLPACHWTGKLWFRKTSFA